MLFVNQIFPTPHKKAQYHIIDWAAVKCAVLDIPQDVLELPTKPLWPVGWKVLTSVTRVFGTNWPYSNI